jgi:hypothetical protein
LIPIQFWNKIKITFSPGCFDNFDGTQEELDEIIAEVTKMFETGDFSSANITYLGENDLKEEDWDELDAQHAKYMPESRNLH